MKVTNYRRLAWVAGLVTLMLLSAGGCSLFRKAPTGAVRMSEDENVVRQVVDNQPDWRFSELRVTGRADEDGNRIGFIGTVRLERNQKVFIVLRSTIGIEVARVFANRDSVWMLSKVLNIKEKGDWRQMAGKLGYPVDFFALQGILVQALFTSSGDRISDLIENLTLGPDKENLMLVSSDRFRKDSASRGYLSEFLLDKENFMIRGSRIRDRKGQWMADVVYHYSKENVVRKIELKGIDSERNFAVEVNVVKKEMKDYLDFNFDKF